MANRKQPFSRSILLIISLLALLLNQIDAERKEYIVYMGDKPESHSIATSLHLNMVQQVRTEGSVLYSYKRSFNGFVAELSDLEMQAMLQMEGVVSIFPNEKKQLHTTRSWDFLGLSQQVDRRLTYESNIVIGVLDTGIWPESESFNDEGMSPPPASWKGTCGPFLNFTCNNKIIGARYYKASGVISPDETASPRDTSGHGTHCASTAAGAIVSGANSFGLAAGTARGGVPSARIAVYKICWSDGCSDADLLAAFDDAIADGVDIVSLSVGSTVTKEYFNDAIAIGTFHAMRNGVLTSTSAGNEGPGFYTTANVAPWALSVAATTIDRKIITKVQLGNNRVYQGVSTNTFDLNKTMYPIVYGGDAPNAAGGFNSSSSRFCLNNTLDSDAVKGKIVLCDTLGTGEPAYLAGAAGTLMQDSRPKDVAWIFPLPTSHLDTISGSSILQYLKLISNPTATIMKSSEGNDTFAPSVVSFSSRGPSSITGDILKPDLAAPGVNILAAFSPKGSLSGIAGDTRTVKYNLMSGSSMACPHATAVAAYVKSFHPNWSPASIKSALMTTASPMTNKNPEDAEFAYGAGHINPLKAVHPGLVYDANTIDYIKFLCGQGYSNKLLRHVTGDNNSTCTSATTANVWDLNYPSFSLSALSATSNVTAVFHRTVTNVGSPVSTYRATVTSPVGLKIQVYPKVLSYKYIGQKLSYTLRITGKMAASINSGSLVWNDGRHQTLMIYQTMKLKLELKKRQLLVITWKRISMARWW